MITFSVTCIGTRLVGDKVAVSFRAVSDAPVGPGPSPMAMGGSEITREVSLEDAAGFTLGSTYAVTIG